MGRCEYCKKKTTEKGVTFHKFPGNGNESVAYKWMANMGKLGQTPGRNHVLCSNHFSEECLEKFYRVTKIKRGCVPTIFEGINIQYYSANGTMLTTDSENHDPNTYTEDANDLIIPLKTCRLALPNSVDVSSNSLLSSLECSNTGPSETLDASNSDTSPSTTPASTMPVTPSTRNQWLNAINSDHRYESTPSTSKKTIARLSEKYEEKKKQLRIVTQQKKRLLKRVHTLQEVIRQQKTHHNRLLAELQQYKNCKN